MPLYKFKRNDVYINTLKTYPEVKLLVYNGTSSFNNTPDISGSFTGSIRMTTPGHISLFEMNVDRSADKTGVITPFIIKDGTKIGFRTTSNASYASEYQLGDIISGSYPETSSITKEYYTSTTARFVSAVISSSAVGKTVLSSGSVSHLHALKNTIDYYRYVDPRFDYSSSVLQRSFENIPLGLISVPTIFYGTQIKPGSVNLKYYFTGSQIAQAQDLNRDGVLYDNYAGSPASGSAIGLVLYNEGFIILTGSTALKSGVHRDTYVSGTDFPRWRYFAQSIPGTAGALGSVCPDSAFLLYMSGTTKIQNITMFATAPKGDLNHSNNPTFVSFQSGSQASSSPTAYVQNEELTIKNIVSSSYNDPTGSFVKTTYVSKIAIYDRNKNLIAIAKPATPIRKTPTRDFTFKLKLDI